MSAFRTAAGAGKPWKLLKDAGITGKSAGHSAGTPNSSRYGRRTKKWGTKGQWSACDFEAGISVTLVRPTALPSRTIFLRKQFSL